MEDDSQELLADCGVTLSDGGVPELHTTAALFRFKLSEKMAANGALAQKCGDYVDSLLSDHDTISLYLDPVSLGDAGDSSMVGRQCSDQPGLLRAESFVRLVLGVDMLQSRVITTLLEKFPEFIGEEDSHEEEGAIKVSVKILRQLRWLDY
ncbi:Fanconi anemia group D2 protein, partial [Coemansia sp. IMI 209127]